MSTNGSKPIPYDLEAEESLLGAMLLSRGAIEVGFDTVAAADFYKPQHQVVLAAIGELWNEGAAVDVQTVASRLDRAGALGGVGGMPALRKLQAGTPASANAAHYASIVAERAASRRAMQVASLISEAARHSNLDEVGRLFTVGLDTIVSPHLTIEPGEDVADLIERDVEADWLVVGLLERGDRIIVTGGEGKGKTTWLQQIATQLASGIHPMTRVEVDPLRVLHVDLENSPAQSIRTYRKLLGAAGERYERGRLIVKSRHDGIDLLQRRDERWLDALMSLHHPDVLVIGPLYKAFIEPEGRSYSESAARAVAGAFDRLRVRHRCALLIEAHSPHGKEGDRSNYRPIGASLWLRWPEFGIGLKAESNAAELVMWKSRDRSRSWPTRLLEGTRWPFEVPWNEMQPEMEVF